MKKWLNYSVKFIFIICLTVGLNISSVSAAQQNAMIDGHIIDDVYLESRGENAFLVLKGLFSVYLLHSIEIVTGKDALNSTITIPNCFLNDLILAPRLSFRSDQILKQIVNEEEIHKTYEDDISFNVNMNIESRFPIMISLDKNESNEKQLVFFIMKKEIQEQNTEPELVLEEPPPKVVEKQMEDLNLEKSEEEKEKKSINVIASKNNVNNVIPEKILIHPVSAMMVFQKPLNLHISILNASPRKDTAERLAILLDRHQRRILEDKIGMKLDITNISSVMETMIFEKTKIYFKPNFLPSALALAQLIPGEQIIEEMAISRQGRLGVDVEIYAGKNFN